MAFFGDDGCLEPFANCATDEEQGSALDVGGVRLLGVPPPSSGGGAGSSSLALAMAPAYARPACSCTIASPHADEMTTSHRAARASVPI